MLLGELTFSRCVLLLPGILEPVRSWYMSASIRMHCLALRQTYVQPGTRCFMQEPMCWELLEKMRDIGKSAGLGCV